MNTLELLFLSHTFLYTFRTEFVEDPSLESAFLVDLKKVSKFSKAALLAEFIA